MKHPLLRYAPDGAQSGTPAVTAPSTAPAVATPPAPVRQEPQLFKASAEEIYAKVQALKAGQQQSIVPASQPLADPIVRDTPATPPPAPVPAQPATPAQPQAGGADAGLQNIDAAAIEALLTGNPGVTQGNVPTPVDAAPPATPQQAQQPFDVQALVKSAVTEALKGVIPALIPKQQGTPEQVPAAPQAPPPPPSPRAEVEALAKAKFEQMAFQQDGVMVGALGVKSPKALVEAAWAGQPVLYNPGPQATDAQKAEAQRLNAIIAQQVKDLRTAALNEALLESFDKKQQAPAPAQQQQAGGEEISVQDVAKFITDSTRTLASKNPALARFSDPDIQDIFLPFAMKAWHTLPAELTHQQVLARAVSDFAQKYPSLVAAKNLGQNVATATNAVDAPKPGIPTVNVPSTAGPASQAPAVSTSESHKIKFQPGNEEAYWEQLRSRAATAATGANR